MNPIPPCTCMFSMATNMKASEHTTCATAAATGSGDGVRGA